MNGQVVITATGNKICRMLNAALFNRFQVETRLLAVYSQDTIFTYQVTLEKKVNAKRLAEIQMFAEGFVGCWKALD